ncbi:alpha-1,4-N-acetylglucosaminyltransferase-like [Ambystoma mexicanum]|uniref:alpha-1,4-N-acetylglucosaminyltransferase-like n=1 Tax=Ambystoma mexicanum TaxID=8296 RepID=UPI0037E8E350
MAGEEEERAVVTQPMGSGGSGEVRVTTVILPLGHMAVQDTVEVPVQNPVPGTATTAVCTCQHASTRTLPQVSDASTQNDSPMPAAVAIRDSMVPLLEAACRDGNDTTEDARRTEGAMNVGQKRHKIDPSKQRYWTHHVSDACRAALVWKYGGIYMDTDVVSLRPVPVEDFLVAEDYQYCSSTVLGFRKHHPFLWDCMADYVTNYNGDKFGQQGPLLYTRMSAKLCKMPDFAKVGDAMCQNISYLQPKRFYPFLYTSWNIFYEKWENLESLESVFKLSYGLHFWNFLNKKHKEVTAGSNSLAEHLFKEKCPLTYYSLVKRNTS